MSLVLVVGLSLPDVPAVVSSMTHNRHSLCAAKRKWKNLLGAHDVSSPRGNTPDDMNIRRSSIYRHDHEASAGSTVVDKLKMFLQTGEKTTITA